MNSGMENNDFAFQWPHCHVDLWPRPFLDQPAPMSHPLCPGINTNETKPDQLEPIPIQTSATKLTEDNQMNLEGLQEFTDAADSLPHLPYDHNMDLPEMNESDFDELFDDEEEEAKKIQEGDKKERSKDVDDDNDEDEDGYDDDEDDDDCHSSVHHQEAAVSPKSKNRRHKWGFHFARLLEFKEEHGHCKVPTTTKEHRQLGLWVKRQRYHMKLYMQGKTSPITLDRLEQLEEIGFVFDSHADHWDKMFEELVSHTQQDGSISVLPISAYNPKLGLWIKRQRRMFALGSMPIHRVKRLEDIGFTWKARSQR